jgi:hypothetical protein
MDRRGRVVYPYKRPFRDGSTHVVLEPLDFMFRMNGMPRVQGCARAAIARLAALVPRPRLNLTRFHSAGESDRTSCAQRKQQVSEAVARVFAPNCKQRARIVPRRPQGRVEQDKPLAPMTWAQRLKRVFAIDIETCPDCGGRLRVIACTRHGFTPALLGLRPNRTLVLACAEEPQLIAKILGHVRARDEATSIEVRAPPGRVEGVLKRV